MNKTSTSHLYSRIATLFSPIPHRISPVTLLSLISYLLSPVTLLSLISYLLSPFAVFAATPPLELLPFTYAGRIVDYAHVAYDGDTTVEVRVKAKDGTLLAKTTTVTCGNTVFNYVVSLPLASSAISGHVKAGDDVTFEFVDPDGAIYTGLIAQGDARIGNPGEYRKVDVIVASDANHDGVADEYVETLEYLMWMNGISEYDAGADYDGDGQSNLQEYIAGTNPFDKTDKFSVRSMATEKGIDGYIAMKVLVAQGRTYSVSTSGKLGKDVSEWAQTEFSVADPSAALQKRITTGPSETGYRVIYVKKDGAQRFWRLEVE